MASLTAVTPSSCSSAVPLGISWYALETWKSGKGNRDAHSDTVIGCQRLPEHRSKYGLQSSGDAMVDVSGLTDEKLASLCAELDVSAHGRNHQIAALCQPVISTADVHRYVLLPKCAAERCSYVDTLRDTSCVESLWNGSVRATGPATVFVSHVWSAPFDDLLSALDEYMRTVPLERRAHEYFWLDVCCLNPYESVAFDSADWSQTFSEMVKAIDHTLLVCLPALNPEALQRSWCIWEVFCTLQGGVALTTVTSHAETAALADFGRYAGAVEAIASIDSQNARATFAADKTRIDDAIMRYGGHQQINDAVRSRLLAELLSRALERGNEHMSLIRSLVDAGASLETEVGVYRSNALATASSPRPGIVERQRLKLDGRLEAVRELDAEVVRFLLSRGANVNHQSSKTGDTALIGACRYGDRPTVLLLLEARADPNLAQYTPNDGETAFLTAARWGNAHLLADLAAAGADVNATTHFNYLDREGNAAMSGGMYRSVDHLQTLQQVGCNLHYTNNAGTSVASVAAAAGCVESLAYLLEVVQVADPDRSLHDEMQRLRSSQQQ